MNYYNTPAYRNPMARWYGSYPLYKRAAQAPMDPAMMGMPPAAPPMDPSMMGGAPLMDPSMMGGAPPMDPSMMGGAPPMDPSMMGTPPPMDPSMMGMPPAAPPMDPSMMGMPPAGEEPKKSKKQALDEQVAKISTGIYNMQIMLAAIIDQCGVKLPPTALITPPDADGPDITNPVPSLVDISTGDQGSAAPLTPEELAPEIGGEMPKTGSLRSLLRRPSLADLLR